MIYTDEYIMMVTILQHGKGVKPMTAAIILRPVEPERDFDQIAALFTLEQDEPTTLPALKIDYEEHKARIFRLMAAENERGDLMGFSWATRSRADPDKAYIYVIVSPEQRGQGAGSRLYTDVEQAAMEAGISQLEISVRDTCPAYRTFADRRGFTEHTHQIGMELDLETFDPRPYDAVIAGLKARGFEFTSMEALGNTAEAQRKLYELNDTVSSETMGSDGEHPWPSFEDFQKSVCWSSWYIPAGQMVVIDSATGIWAAMSAITRFEGADFAYNLFTGVDKRYRGRKLAQAVKVLALGFAREVLGVSTVRTNHNTRNEPMLAIDRKLGYVQSPGWFTLRKEIEACK